MKYFSTLEEKFHISTQPCNILYIFMCTLFIHLNIDIHLLDIFRGLQSEQEVLLTHGDSIDRVASGLKVIAKSGDIVAGNFENSNFFWPGFVSIFACGLIFISLLKKHCPVFFFPLICSLFARKNVCVQVHYISHPRYQDNFISV